MNVLFHLRSDTETKHGGDVSLGRQYKKILEGLGHSVDMTTSAFAFSGQYDLALTFNFDRPFESAQFIKNCKRKKIPVFIYALHHPAAGLSHYLKSGTSGARKIFARMALFRPTAYESILTLVKVITGGFKFENISHLSFISTKFAQKYIAKNVERILVSSHLEALEIAREFFLKNDKFFIIPHILDLLPVDELNSRKEYVRDIDVVCAGRIESRKNQLKVARLAKKMNTVKFSFVGTPSPSESSYFNDFSREIEGLANVSYQASMPMPELRDLFLRSKIFISLSWFEVVSLTEMEAMTCGCQIVVGKYSYVKEYASSLATFVVPDDIDSIEKVLERLLKEMSFSDAKFLFNADDKVFEMRPAAIAEAFSSLFSSLKEVR